MLGSKTSKRSLPLRLCACTSRCRRCGGARRRVVVARRVHRDADARADEELLARRGRTAARACRAAAGATSIGAVASARPRAGSRTRRRPCGRPCRRRAAQLGGARRPRSSSWSPSLWPRLSLTVLKSSRSRKSTASGGRAPRCADRVLQAVEEQRSVGKPGERVVERLVAQLVLERLAARDVAVVDDDAADRRVVEQVLRTTASMTSAGAVGVLDPDLGRDLRRPAAGRRRRASGRHVAVVGWTIARRCSGRSRSSAR